MVFQTVYIRSFGTLKEREFSLLPGLNIIEGPNESGKTAFSMFLKFVFYGLSGRATDGSLSERRRYVNWETGEAAGYVLLEWKGHSYRVERSLQLNSRVGQSGEEKESYRESCRIIDCETGSQVMKNQIPGEVFFGLPEEIFQNTVFIGQMSGSAVNGEDISAAIENLLLSGSETVNTQKALKSLDDARKMLLYKNGKGGLLYEKQRQRAAAAETLENAKRQAEESLTAEETLRDLYKRREEEEKEVVSLKRQCDAYGIFEKNKQFAALSAERQKLADVEQEIGTLADSPATRAHLEAIRSASREIVELENQKEEAEQALQVLDRRLAAEERQKSLSAKGILAAAEKEIHKLTAAGRRLLSFGIAALVIAVLLFVGGGVIFSRMRLSGIGLLAAGGVLALLAFALFLIRARGRGQLRAAEEALREASAPKAVDPQRQVLCDKLRMAEIILNSQTERGAALAAAVHIPEGMPLGERLEKAAVRTEEICRQREALERERAACAARRDLLSTQLQNENEDELRQSAGAFLATEEGRKAARFSEADVAEAKRRIYFMEERLRYQAAKERELESLLAAQKATAVSPGDARSALDALEEEIASLTRKYEAYVLAYQTLENALERIRTRALPRIAGEAGARMAAFSAGRYGTLGTDAQFRLSYTDGGVTRPLDVLSAGTRDIAYVSLRLSLVAVLCGEESVPAIFDESFARVDESRLGEIIRFLSAEGAGQTLLLTCRHAEGEYWEGGQVIRLGEINK